MKVLIAIDDTDNLESRGTGFQSRQLGKLIAELNIGKIAGITRHQLYVHDDIPYTSHNSSACIEAEIFDFDSLTSICRNFLLNIAADGSDAGLCIAKYEDIHQDIINWGHRAKKEILTKTEAHQLAEANNIYLEGLTGDKIGVIGSLAAIGLHFDGNDGRYLWIAGKEMREIQGIFTISELKNISTINNVLIKENYNFVADSDTIFIEDWLRPILKNKQAVIIVEKSTSKEYDWKALTKIDIKLLTQ
ncbi:MAG: hypothetical protein HXX18_07595 [Bacteroidetes bacterium]|nr:hypothetical protein [Bacteroidota bacterium]